ncbi:GntR family transcriptional regulator [Rhodobaculum claviforme]|uniref:Transcriptional regulator n=1 Tax=Rhodobaculum claviforme TaxID=1549854 RepID=A0A934WHS2_9RHOB|nr:GntR family transcriptional regulator [Rhodobaculum claviforme]MBK5925813.1 transcriptional regulator [Rhodobaculum claviforme]
MPDPRPSATVETICERIWLAIAERRLRPGARLKEEQLAEIFEVSRARIRQAFAMLERDGLILLVPNRGACVAEPTIDEARDVFFARRAIEGRVVERLCARIDAPGIARLRAHVEAERAAHAARDRSAIVRLSGAFHLLIAELSGAGYLQQVLRDLISRTSLITAVYQPQMVANCGPDEHADLVEAIAAGHTARAVALMAAHLDHVERDIDLQGAADPPRDLREALL